MSSDRNPSLTTTDAKDCIRTVLSWIRHDEELPEAPAEVTAVMKSVEEARQASENDMVALMNRVYPIISELTAQAIAPLGYTQDGSGVLQFERAVQTLLPQDAELARLHSELRSYYLPAIVFPAPHANTNTS